MPLTSIQYATFNNNRHLLILFLGSMITISRVGNASKIDGKPLTCEIKLDLGPLPFPDPGGLQGR